MKFRYTTLFVADLPRALAFYEAAFGLRAGFVHGSGRCRAHFTSTPSSSLRRSIFD